jgi:hypothetical protein
MEDNFLLECEHVTTTAEFIHFGLCVYQMLKDERHHKPIDECIENVNDAMWHHSPSDEIHNQRLQALRDVLDHDRQ